MRYNLYTVDVDYVKFLRKNDNRVPEVFGKKSNRPFVGVLICVNAKNYFAPLTSPKQKHIQMKDRQDFIRIEAGKYGAINFNNMIPIPRRYLNKIYINMVEDKKYAKLLEYQTEWINSNKSRITKIARNLYHGVTTNAVTEELKIRCCNFKLLEKKCYEYMSINNIMEEELEYMYA